MNNIAISVRNLSKKYYIGETISLAKTLQSIAKLPINIYKKYTNQKISEDPHIWALKDVSFDLEKGKILGIIGRNGSGKSTLLKILSRITLPTSGNAKIYGQVASLLEVGTGFNHELTGRDNIYLNGAILGFSQKEITEKFDDIVAFSEIGSFIDTPIKRYSSGMAVRLGFAVAAHLETEIMIIDEVLAVGDQGFQKKCIERMEKLRENGRTLLFVSHTASSVADLCDNVLWLHQGQVKEIGETNEVLQKYSEFFNDNKITNNRVERNQCGNLHIKKANLYNHNNQLCSEIAIGEKLVIELQYEANNIEILPNIKVLIRIINNENKQVMVMNTEWFNNNINVKPSGSISCIIDKLPLASGSYSLNVTMNSNNTEIDEVKYIANFQVKAGDFFDSGIIINNDNDIYYPHMWQF
jgi:lipopolysaccharide transport system ATP-binding protein